MRQWLIDMSIIGLATAAFWVTRGLVWMSDRRWGR